MATELEMFVQDRRLALFEIESVEAYYQKQIAFARDDLRIAEEGIARELAKIKA